MDIDMESLYNISNDILELFDNIEAQDGEITEEQEKLLDIKQGELREKLNNYYKAILSWKNDINNCKEEINRIKSIQNRYDKRIERLSNSMITAIKQFGDEKKGKRFIELPTVKLSIRNSSITEINEDRIDYLITILRQYITYLYNEGILHTGIDVNMNLVLDNINDIVKEEKGELYPLFTISDLNNLELEINVNYTIEKLFKKGKNIIEDIATKPIDVTIKNHSSKTRLKDAITLANDNDNLSCPTIATIKQNENLSIK